MRLNSNSVPQGQWPQVQLQVLTPASFCYEDLLLNGRLLVGCRRLQPIARQKAGLPFLGLEPEAETTGEERDSGKTKGGRSFCQETRQETDRPMGLEGTVSLAAGAG